MRFRIKLTCLVQLSVGDYDGYLPTKRAVEGKGYRINQLRKLAAILDLFCPLKRFLSVIDREHLSCVQAILVHL